MGHFRAWYQDQGVSVDVLLVHTPEISIPLFKPLLDIMVKLRNSQNSCPWDRVESFETIVPFIFEESYEVADSIEGMAIDELTY